MQNETIQTAKSIKISSTGKGLHNWEDQLLANQESRIRTFFLPLNLHHTKLTWVIETFKSQVDRENIVSLHGHSIETFLTHLLDNTLGELANHTSIKTKKS